MADSRISFIISALDQTGAAFNSVRTGMRGIKTDAELLNVGFKGIAASLASGVAAYVSLGQAVQLVTAAFQKGFKAVETYNQSVASLAAMVVTFGEKKQGETLESQWKGALKYSTAMVPVLENISARTLLSGEETTALANAFARAGTFLDANNAKQVEAFTRISNAIPLMTQGQAIMLQINQEVRGLMNGGNIATSMLLQTLKAIDPQIEKHLAIWREQNTVMENIGELLAGFGPATALLENQWQAVKSTIDTTATQILRGVMKPAYEEIIKLTQKLNTYLVENKTAIMNWGAAVEERFKTIFKIVSATYNVLKWVDKFSFSSPYRSPNNNIKGLWEYEAERQENAVPSPPKGRAGLGGDGGESAAKKAASAAKKAADEYKRLVEQADKYIDKANDEVSLEGMTGLRKALQENEIEYQNTIALYTGLDEAKKKELTTSALALKNMKDQQAVQKETESQRQKAVQAAKEQASYELQMSELAKENAIKHGTFFEGAVEGYRKYREEAITAFSAGRDAVIQMSNAMSNAMSTMFFDVITGKFENLMDEFRSFGQSIIKIFTDMLAQMIVKSMAAEASNALGWMGGLSGIGSLFGSLMGGGGALATAGGGSFWSGISAASMFHGGGNVGGEPGGAYRLVPSSAFFGAPRYHNGLATDEYAAILKRNENVFTAGQTRALGARLANGSGDNSTQNINLTIVAADARSFSDMIKRNPSSVIKPITDALKQNQMNKTWKELLK